MGSFDELTIAINTGFEPDEDSVKPVNIDLLFALVDDSEECNIANVICDLEMCGVPMTKAVRALGVTLGVLCA